MNEMFHDLGVLAAEVRVHAQFLARFVGRGWLHGTRDDHAEQAAVNFGLRNGWLRHELSEVHFTPKGRQALASEKD